MEADNKVGKAWFGEWSREWGTFIIQPIKNYHLKELLQIKEKKGE